MPAIFRGSGDSAILGIGMEEIYEEGFLPGVTPPCRLGCSNPSWYSEHPERFDGREFPCDSCGSAE